MDRLIEFATNHWVLFASMAVILYLLIQDFFESATRKYQLTSAVGAVGLMNSKEVTILDVREPSEHIKSHIEDSLNIPVTKFDTRINELDEHRDKIIIVTCQSGTRSPEACKKLAKAGFENIYLLSGGMQGWEDLNLPIRKKRPKHRK